ncbi:MAG TPA: IS3 family transposase [Candidatus Dormibacteraeota bacterium]|nr:IS3 family transposase [Candidatus Dormibacteraeota bacterium]
MVATAKRRQFPASQKRRIVAAADACKKPGELGALLRREGIYSSMLSTWRKQIARANEQALAPRRRGPKPDPARPERLRIERLEREKARLERELAQARLIIDVQKKVATFAGDPAGRAAQGRRVIEAFETLRSGLAVSKACQALGVARSAIYRAHWRRRDSELPRVRRRRPCPPLALTAAERERLLAVLNSERFVDMAPAAIYATLLDEGCYLASVRTMYRLLTEQGQTPERRRQRVHPHYEKPELLATRANQVWSWDITKLKGPVRWSVYHLYVILDIFSRYVVGWMVALREAAELAEQLIADTLAKQQIAPDTLTLHADRGTSMRSKPVAALLIDLDVARTHSRPHVSDDNPYSESQFKTLKYRPEFPARFGSLEDARAHCQRFFGWYNHEHRHSGIGLMTPHAVHYGVADTLQLQRAQTLQRAYATQPLRFKGRMPTPPALPTAAWINPPKKETTTAILNPRSLNTSDQVSQSD